MDEERLKQAARRAAEILAQAKVTAARANQTLDRGKEARTVAAETLSRARRAEVWAEAAIGRLREVGQTGNATGANGTVHDPAHDAARTRRLRQDQVWRAEALARQRAAEGAEPRAADPGDRPDPPDPDPPPPAGS